MATSKRLRPGLRLLAPAALIVAAVACRRAPDLTAAQAAITLSATRQPAQATVTLPAAGQVARATVAPTPTEEPVQATAGPSAVHVSAQATAGPSAEHQSPQATATPVADAASTAPRPASATQPAILPLREVKAAAWSPTGEVLAVARGAGIHLWTPQAAGDAPAFEAGAGVCSLAFHPQGRILAASTCSNTVELWDVEARLLVRALDGPNRRVPEHAYDPASSTLTDVAFSPDGSTLAATVQGYYGGGQGSVWLWQADTGELLGILSTYGAAQRVELGPGGTILAATMMQTCARGGGGITVWGSTTDPAPRILSDGRNSVIDLALQPGGLLVATAGGHGDLCAGPAVVQVWELATGTQKYILLEGTPATAVACSGDGALLASGDEAGAIHLWDLATGERRDELAGQGARVVGLAFRRDGRALVAWDAGGTASVWEWP